MKKSALFIIALSALIISCGDKAEKEAKTADKYEKTKLSLEEIEKQTPEKFIAVAGSDKKNLLGQTVVKGKVTNNAKMATFKDVDIKLFFYSKTGVLLQEDQEMIYETIAPGATKSFKSKYFAPKGTDSIAMKVVSAKF
ncbi:MAG: hypothetical protein EOO03_06310 [Chitinophagaceae bacterium]|nr:MAG: hypothetical protein EOO03_06310 [Chitinophagaceae bacterium]